jgi:hypothetical protein
MALRGRIGAHVTHSRHDSHELTRHAREAFLSSFEHQVDPNGTLPEAERQRRAEHARKAHMTRLALQSARVRSSKETGPGVATPEPAAEVRRGVAESTSA